MKEKRPDIVPGAKYDFEERLREIQITIRSCFREIIKLGFPEELTHYSIRNPIKERRSVQIRFSPAIIKVMRRVSKKSRVQNMILKLHEAEKIETQIITVTSREVFVISDGGFSVLRYIMKISCEMIKSQLETKRKRREKKIQNNKKRSLEKANEMISSKEAFRVISVAHKKEGYTLTLITKTGNGKMQLRDKSSIELITAIGGLRDIIQKIQ